MKKKLNEVLKNEMKSKKENRGCLRKKLELNNDIQKLRFTFKEV